MLNREFWKQAFALRALLAVLGICLAFWLPELVFASESRIGVFTDGANWVGIWLIACLLSWTRPPFAFWTLAGFFILFTLGYHAMRNQFGVVLEPHHVRMAFTETAGVVDTFRDSIAVHWPVIITALASLVLVFIARTVSKAHSPKTLAAPILVVILVASLGARLVIKDDVGDYQGRLSHHSIRAGVETSFVAGVRMLHHVTIGQPSPPDYPRRVIDQSKIEKRENEIVVVVMGESIRAPNMSLYGYHRKTTPLLEKRAAMVGPNGFKLYSMPGLSYTPASSATVSQFYNLSDHPRDVRFNFGPELNMFRLAQQQGFRTHYIASQVYKGLTIAYPEHLDVIEYREKNAELFRRRREAMILDFLPTQFPSGNQLYYLHQWVNHIPFEEHCPGRPDLRPFPADDDVLQNWINSHDNGLRCYDESLDAILERFATIKDRPVHVFVTADHGMLAGEHGLRGHGHPFVTTHIVPMMLYTNRPNGEIAHKFNQIVGTHYEMTGLIADAMGLPMTGGYDPLKKIYLGGTVALGPADYMRLTRIQGTQDFTVDTIRWPYGTVRESVQPIPFLAKRLDQLKSN